MKTAYFERSPRSSSQRYGTIDRYRQEASGGFKCRHCHAYVCADYLISGVQKRNHCPYCLWSRHVDLFRAGDRLAACKAQMRPVGLTVKKTVKKYGSDTLGELMVIHLCTDCSKVSINRIAADDLPEMIYRIFENSVISDEVIAQLEEGEINVLTSDQAEMVFTRLFGYSLAV